ncbi:MAG: DUF1801 domain-containing protein [Rikenellaceae bacterium]|nr:DUF1801 domain-containing protein [Rikenellaceae bacterium]
MNEDPPNFYFDKEEPLRGTLLALRRMILDHNKNISETVKYGMPCFLFKKNILCYLWTDSKTHEPYILMADGRHLVNPALEQGKRSRMKIFRIDPHAEIDVKTLETILNEAIAVSDASSS